MRKKAQFGQVVSGYVDPTPEGLNKAYQRHMDNLIQSEALRRESNELKAAPFEGDQQLRRELLTSTDNALMAVSQEASKNSYGNLSNFTNSVLRAGTLYKKGTAPLTKNLTAYNTYQKQLQDKLDKGDIDAEDYSLNMGLSTMGYKGLEVDADGNVGKYFQGSPIWNDPDILGMIDKAIKNISTDGNSVTTDVIGYNNGMFDVKTTEGIKQIHPDKVRAALAGVMNDPKVQGYYGNKSKGRAYLMEQDKVEEALSKEIETLKEADEPDLEKIAEVQKALESGSSETMREQLASDMKRDMLSVYENAAVAGKSKDDRVFKQDFTYNKLYLKSLEDQAAGSAVNGQTSGILITDEAINYTRPGGGDPAKHAGLISVLEDNIDNLSSDIDKAVSTNAPPETVNGLVRARERMMQDLVQQENLFKQTYGQGLDELLDTPEYKELSRTLAANRYNSDPGGGGFFNMLGKIANQTFTAVTQLGANPTAALATAVSQEAPEWQEYTSTTRAMRDFVQNSGLEPDPRGPVGSMSVQYVPLSGLGVKVNSGTENDIKTYYSGGFEGKQEVIDPNTGKVVPLASVLPDFENIEYSDVNFSRSAPTNGVPSHMRISYKPKKDADVKPGHILVPLTESAGLQIPALSTLFDSNSWEFVSRIQTLVNYSQKEGSFMMGWAGYKGGDPSSPMMGKMRLDYANGGAVTILDMEGNPIDGDGRPMSILDQQLHRLIDTHKISIRNV